jgi:hypothetical protein
MRLAVAVGATTALLGLSGTADAAVPARKGCTASQTRSLIQRFVLAFNRGDSPTLNRIWDSEPGFQWYSVGNDPGQRIAGDAYRRETLLRYFAERHAAHERLSPVRIQINGASAGYSHFEYRVLRNADDLPAGQVVFDGKGAASCYTGKLAVWSMGVAGRS